MITDLNAFDNLTIPDQRRAITGLRLFLEALLAATDPRTINTEQREAAHNAGLIVPVVPKSPNDKS